MEHHDSSVKLSELPDQPTYNVKAVCVRTGITGATLRAWERRYGVPSPNRSAQGYRLYSERDVAILHWLIQETAKGVNIGHTVQQLHDMLASGQEVSVTIPTHHSTQDDYIPRSPDTIAVELVDAYNQLSERRCDDLINEALALYTLETTMFSILKQALTTVRQDVHRQTALATVENFALNHMRHRLERILQATPLRHPKQSIMLIGFAHEGSALDLIMLTILLRRAGHDAIYMVADFDASLLHTEVAALRASLVLFFVHTPDNVLKLRGLSSAENEHGRLTPMMYAGAASMSKSAVPLEYIGDDVRLIYHALLTRVRHEDALEQDRR